MATTMQAPVHLFPWGRPDERRRVSSHRRYTDAKAALDALVARGIAADAVSIAAHDVREVHSAAAAPRTDEIRRWMIVGLAVGGLLGLAFGLMSWLTGSLAGPPLAVAGVAVTGLVLGAFGAFLLSGIAGRPQDPAAGQLVAGYFDVLVGPVARPESEEEAGVTTDGL